MLGDKIVSRRRRPLSSPATEFTHRVGQGRARVGQRAFMMARTRIAPRKRRGGRVVRPSRPMPCITILSASIRRSKSPPQWPLASRSKPRPRESGLHGRGQVGICASAHSPFRGVRCDNGLTATTTCCDIFTRLFCCLILTGGRGANGCGTRFNRPFCDGRHGRCACPGVGSLTHLVRFVPYLD